jgi:hypothetical protein
MTVAITKAQSRDRMLRSTRVPPHKRNLFADPTAIALRGRAYP